MDPRLCRASAVAHRTACCTVPAMRLAVVISVALASGCGDREAAQLESVKAVVCSCKTPRCAEEAMKRVPQRGIKSTHKAQRVAHEMIECVARLYEDERPSTDPDGVTSPETSGPASARTP